MDSFNNFTKGLTAPISNHYQITPNDSTDLATVPRAVYVGQTGNIAWVDKNGTSVIWVGVAGGSLLPIRPIRILATGTTATGLVAGY